MKIKLAYIVTESGCIGLLVPEYDYEGMTASLNRVLTNISKFKLESVATRPKLLEFSRIEAV